MYTWLVLWISFATNLHGGTRSGNTLTSVTRKILHKLTRSSVKCFLLRLAKEFSAPPSLLIFMTATHLHRHTRSSVTRFFFLRLPKDFSAPPSLPIFMTATHTHLHRLTRSSVTSFSFLRLAKDFSAHLLTIKLHGDILFYPSPRRGVEPPWQEQVENLKLRRHLVFGPPILMMSKLLRLNILHSYIQLRITHMTIQTCCVVDKL